MKGEYENADGKTTTLVNGKNGVSQVNYTAKVINGVTVETVVNSTVTLSNPVNRRQVIGATTTSVATATSSSVSCISTLSPSSPIELDANGAPINYTKKMTVQATAYTYTGHNCATGVAPQPGYIAVNPRVIPYGTRMYIVSSDGRFVYGYAVAADTGGFTSSRPNNVDLFMATKTGFKIITPFLNNISYYLFLFNRANLKFFLPFLKVCGIIGLYFSEA